MDRIDSRSIERAVMADYRRPCLYGVAGPCQHPDCLESHFKTLSAAAPPPPAEQASGDAVSEAVRILNEAGYHDAADDLAALSQRPVVGRYEYVVPNVAYIRFDDDNAPQWDDKEVVVSLAPQQPEKGEG